MANPNNIVSFIKKREGGLSKDLNDSAKNYPCPTPYKNVLGYHTNKGVTYKTWVHFFGTKQDARFYLMSDADWTVIYKSGYWDFIKGDLINNQAIADILVDWTWGSWDDAPKAVQSILKNQFNYTSLVVDGAIGAKSLAAINSVNSQELFISIHQAKLNFYKKLVTDSPKDQANLKGWINRANLLYKQVSSFVDLKKKVV